MAIARRTRSQYNFNTCEFDDLRLPASWGRFTSPRRYKIRFIVVHHMVIRDTDPNDDEALEKCRNIWRTRPASAGYGVDNDFIAQFVSDADAAYATADSEGNHAGISIEHVNKTLNEAGSANDYLISEKTWKTGAKLAAYLHKLYNLGRPVKNVTLRKHSSFFATACPGPYFDKIWNDYVLEAQRVYDGIGRHIDTTPPPAPKPVPVPKPVPKPVPSPKPEASMPVVTGLHWNVAGSDVVNGYGAANDYRGDDLGRWAKKIGFDVFLTCEAGQKDLRAGISKGLGITSWMSKAKAIWFKPTVSQIKPRKVYRDSLFAYRREYKWGAAFFGSKQGRKFAILEVHTDWRKPAKQGKQLRAIFAKFRKDADAYGVKRVNQVVCGDFNWDGTSGDNPFKALAAYNFEEKGDTKARTFFDGRHLDGVLAHKEAQVTVRVRPRNDGRMNLSDHYPLQFKLTLS